MEFGGTHFPAGEPDLGYSFELSPTSASKRGLESTPLADRQVDGNHFDARDITEQLELTAHRGQGSSERVGEQERRDRKS